MDFESVVKNRTATRRFKNEKVPEDVLTKILESGRLAPTAKNKQPQKIYVVSSTEGLEKIDKVSPCRYNSQTVLMVCSDKNIACSLGEDSTYVIDACIVATHLMLAATNYGVDNIWIEYFDRKLAKEVFNLDENIEPICLIPLGYKTEDYKGNPVHGSRKELSETVEYI